MAQKSLAADNKVILFFSAVLLAHAWNSEPVDMGDKVMVALSYFVSLALFLEVNWHHIEKMFEKERTPEE